MQHNILILLIIYTSQLDSTGRLSLGMRDNWYSEETPSYVPMLFLNELKDLFPFNSIDYEEIQFERGICS